MAHGNLEDSQLYSIDWKSGRWSLEKKALTGEHTVTNNGQIVHALDANGADRTVRLPPLDERGGQVYLILNRGASNDLNIVSQNGDAVTTLIPADAVFVVSDDAGWTALRGWADLGVFTNVKNGLVPYPNSVTPGSLFLRDDGQWAQIQVTGIVDAFKFITDGTTIAIGAGPDTFRLRSSTGKVTVVVQNNDVTFGDNANFSVNEAAVDHNALLNYVADKHVAHTGVVLTAGLGLSGGGDISASRTFALDLSELPVVAPILGDYVPLYDSGTPQQIRATLGSINAVLDHNALLNYSADRHIAHSGVSIIAGVGISGGGDITTSRTISLDINGLSVSTVATGDFIPFYSLTGSTARKITFANLTASMDHDSLLHYVANQHIDHSTVSISTTEGVQGGGTIAATRTLKLDINGLAADATPDSSADYIVTWDASAGVHKKVLIQNIPSASGFDIHGLTALTALDAADEVPVYDVSASSQRKVVVSDFFKSINTLTLKSAIAPGDFFAIYDLAGTAGKKVLAQEVTARGDFAAMSNGQLVVSGSVGALTIALKTAAGIDPSATDPVYFFFRDNTMTSGALVRRAVTAALSLTLASTKTLGAPSWPCLWISAHDDAGTVQLGAAIWTTSTGTYCPSESVRYSTTVPDNSAKAFHTTAALGAVPWRFLAYCEWSSAVTPGTWTTPAIVHPFGPGTKRPGELVQSERSATGAVNTGTTAIPNDDSIPQITEGKEYMTQSITPLSQANRIRVSSKAMLGATAANSWLIMALFQDATANALATAAGFQATAFAPIMTDVTCELTAATLSATTFRMRAGSDSATTVTFNGANSARMFGGVANSYILVEEYKA